MQPYILRPFIVYPNMNDTIQFVTTQLHEGMISKLRKHIRNYNGLTLLFLSNRQLSSRTVRHSSRQSWVVVLRSASYGVGDRLAWMLSSNGSDAQAVFTVAKQF